MRAEIFLDITTIKPPKSREDHPMYDLKQPYLAGRTRKNTDGPPKNPGKTIEESLKKYYKTALSA